MNCRQGLGVHAAGNRHRREAVAADVRGDPLKPRLLPSLVGSPLQHVRCERGVGRVAKDQLGTAAVHPRQVPGQVVAQEGGDKSHSEECDQEVDEDEAPFSHQLAYLLTDTYLEKGVWEPRVTAAWRSYELRLLDREGVDKLTATTTTKPKSTDMFSGLVPPIEIGAKGRRRRKVVLGEGMLTVTEPLALGSDVLTPGRDHFAPDHPAVLGAPHLFAQPSRVISKRRSSIARPSPARPGVSSASSATPGPNARRLKLACHVAGSELGSFHDFPREGRRSTSAWSAVLAEAIPGNRRAGPDDI
jgi:hypothetical protein